jgi:hypothetical protein
MADRCTLGSVPNGSCNLSFGLASHEVGAKRLSQSPEQGDPIELSSVSRSVGPGPGVSCLRRSRPSAYAANSSALGAASG